jgi:hypothetical protein
MTYFNAQGQGRVGWKSPDGGLTPSYLLDTYSGAAAAYSLRKLRTTYTGNAITVRRSSDNTSQQIGFDANGNLDTTTLLSFVGAGNGFVSTWFDQSGSGRNATQAAANNQPQIISSGTTSTLNGKPIIAFNGTSQFLQTASAVVGGPFGIFGVGNTPSGSTNSTLLTQYTAFDAYRFLLYMEKPPSTIVGVQVGSNYVEIAGTPTYGQKLYYYNRNNSNLVEVGHNNSSVNTATITTGAQSFRLSFGYFNGGTPQYTRQNLQECVIYQSDKSSSRTGISSNINTYYSIY